MFGRVRYYRCGFWVCGCYHETWYTSRHRNGSQKNLRDALAAIKLRYGCYVANHLEFVWTQLED